MYCITQPSETWDMTAQYLQPHEQLCISVIIEDNPGHFYCQHGSSTAVHTFNVNALHWSQLSSCSALVTAEQLFCTGHS